MVQTLGMASKNGVFESSIIAVQKVERYLTM